jgi:predicted subunit of tRNA(5-methylaminomethyl-2-thiouridylate) methyltransferase
MKFDKIDITIKDYLGRMAHGVVATLSIIYETKVYEAAYWYDTEYNIIQLPRELIDKIGEIEKHNEYENIIKYLKEACAEYEKIAPELNDIFKQED